MEALRRCTHARVIAVRCLASLTGAVTLLVLTIGLLANAPAQAQIGSDRYSSIVTDATTGNVLIAVSADEPRYPASLTKMMTLYMVFEALRDHRLRLEQPVPVSSRAAAMSPSKLGLVPETRITVEQAILGLVTKSANDAAAALGELLGGDEDRFADMMTLRAHALGMLHTRFRNASGLPDSDQVSTARDLAVLARHLVQDFPAQYRYFSAPSFVFHGHTILNHDHLLQTYPGADGIKTGYIVASGFNLVTSAVRGDVRLIGVVLGAAKPVERDSHMAALLDQGFEQMGVPPIAPRQEVAVNHLSLIGTAQAAALPKVVSPGTSAAPLPIPPMAVASAASRLHPPAARWSVLLTGFDSEGAARASAVLARRAADGGDIHVAAQTSHGHTAYRAMLTGLSQSDARTACAAVSKRHVACQPLRPEAGQVASR